MIQDKVYRVKFKITGLRDNESAIYVLSGLMSFQDAMTWTVGELELRSGAEVQLTSFECLGDVERMNGGAL